MRLKDKTAIIVGAGQTPGTTIGNGRAMAILFAREAKSKLMIYHMSSREGVELVRRGKRSGCCASV